MERAKGIEPSSKAWEAFVLPLNHARSIQGWLDNFCNEETLQTRFAVNRKIVNTAIGCDVVSVAR